MKERYSQATLKSMGFNEQEIRLIQARNREYGQNPILTSDSLIMKKMRVSGLSDIDQAQAESFQQEFGHITEPWTYQKRK